jgi:hypothetical protein
MNDANRVNSSNSIDLTFLSQAISPVLKAIAVSCVVLPPQTAQANQWTAVELPNIVTCGVVESPAPSAILGVPNLLCQRREVTADVLVFRNTTPPSGAIKPTVITMQPGRGRLLGISFFESQLDTAGEQWRSSAWTAITNSSFLLGEDLNQYSFSFDAEGLCCMNPLRVGDSS